MNIASKLNSKTKYNIGNCINDIQNKSAAIYSSNTWNFINDENRFYIGEGWMTIQGKRE